MTEAMAVGGEKIHDLNRETAGLLRRGFAAWIDSLLFWPVGILIFLPHLISAIEKSASRGFSPEGDWWRVLLGDGLLFIYSVLMIGRCGRTVGMMALRIRVTNLDGSDIGFKRAFLRTIAFWIPCGLTALLVRYEVAIILLHAFIVIGLLWIMVDKKHQGYHDKIANTLVMREKCYQEGKAARKAAEGRFTAENAEGAEEASSH